ncbi:MAG: hypothetical protein AB1611_00375 [bacterium]
MREYKDRVREYFSHKKGEGLILSPINWLVIEKWEKMGIPLHVVIQGIDKTFEHLRSSGLQQKKVHHLAYCEPEIMNLWKAHQKKSYIGSGTHNESGIQNGSGIHDGSGNQYEGAATHVDQMQQSSGEEQKKLREYIDRRISLAIREITRAMEKLNKGAGSSQGADASMGQESNSGEPLTDVFGRIVGDIHLEEELASLQQEIRACHRIDAEAIEKRLQGLDERLVQGLLDALPADKRDALLLAAQRQTRRYKNQMESDAYQETVRACSIELLRAELGIHQLSLYQ